MYFMERKQTEIEKDNQIMIVGYDSAMLGHKENNQLMFDYNGKQIAIPVIDLQELKKGENICEFLKKKLSLMNLSKDQKIKFILNTHGGIKNDMRHIIGAKEDNVIESKEFISALDKALQDLDLGKCTLSYITCFGLQALEDSKSLELKKLEQIISKDLLTPSNGEVVKKMLSTGKHQKYMNQLYGGYYELSNKQLVKKVSGEKSIQEQLRKLRENEAQFNQKDEKYDAIFSLLINNTKSFEERLSDFIKHDNKANKLKDKLNYIKARTLVHFSTQLLPLYTEWKRFANEDDRRDNIRKTLLLLFEFVHLGEDITTYVMNQIQNYKLNMFDDKIKQVMVSELLLEAVKKEDENKKEKIQDAKKIIELIYDKESQEIKLSTQYSLLQEELSYHLKEAIKSVNNKEELEKIKENISSTLKESIEIIKRQYSEACSNNKPLDNEIGQTILNLIIDVIKFNDTNPELQIGNEIKEFFHNIKNNKELNNYSEKMKYYTLPTIIAQSQEILHKEQAILNFVYTDEEKPHIIKSINEIRQIELKEKSILDRQKKLNPISLNEQKEK